jgi:putative Mg2+ transporter-C (MgtC) family protein
MIASNLRRTPIIMEFAEMAGKLGLAMLLGAMVGLERERRDRPAGLRTHIIVCVGSTLITMVSVYMAGPHSDSTRIAAQIVSGIGFLGAGTIFRSGTAVRGLTTAAGLWVVAGIGMAVAAGGIMQALAGLTAMMVFATNMWVRLLEDRLVHPRRDVLVRVAQSPGSLGRVLTGIERHGGRLESLELLEADATLPREQMVRLRVRILPDNSVAELLTDIADIEGVREVTLG